jgi:hypothetical protein
MLICETRHPDLRTCGGAANEITSRSMSYGISKDSRGTLPYNERMPPKIRVVFFILVHLCVIAHAKVRRTIPAGLLFPAFPLAGYVNPSIMPLEKGTGFMGAFTLSDSQYGSSSGIAGLSHSKKDKAFGFGYLGSFPSSGSTATQAHGAFLGGGIKMENVSVGVSANDSDLTTGLNPLFDLAITAKLTNALVGAVVRQINSGAAPSVGIGYGTAKYSLEFDAILPAFSQIGTSNGTYSFGISGAIYGGFTVAFSTFYSTSFTQSGGSFLHSLWVQVWVSDTINLMAQFQSSQTITIGASIYF